MKKFFICLLLGLLSVLSVQAQVATEGYYINNYNVKMTVHDDNTYAVNEDIDVTFTEPHHGIFRMIPVSPYVKRDISEKQDGSKWEVKGYSVKVNDVQVSEASSDEYQSDVYQIQIGSADSYLIGPHHYQISYTLCVPWDRVKQSDLFFYSIHGSGWGCTVEKFSFSLHFDKPIPQESLAKLKVFSGENGDSINCRDKILTKVTTTDIAGEKSNINPYEAITLYTPLPEGYFSYNLWQDKAAWILVALAIIMLVVVIYIEVFRPAEVIKIMTVSPPEGMTSAEVGTLFDCSVDDCDIVSLIPWFASKGYISIDNTGEHPVLHKLNKLPKDAPHYQQMLFCALFANGDTFDTGEKTSRSFGKSWLNTKEHIENYFYGKLDKIDKKLMFMYLAALLLSVLAIGIATCVDGMPLCLLLLAEFALLAFGIVNAGKKHFKKITCIGIGVLVALYLMTIFSEIGAFWSGSDLYIPKEPLYVILALLSVATIFMYKAVVMTPYRRQKMGEILGLEEFIRLSEEPQLRQLQADEERYFYDVLPYAVAFGMSEVWAKKFSNIIVSPNENFISSTDNGATPFTYYGFTQGFMTSGVRSGIKAENTYRAQQAAKAAAGSSSSSAGSFSGGGFSGGGFGGGGGGAW